MREVVRAADVLAPSARDRLARVGAHLGTDLGTDEHVAELVGPVVYAVLSTGTAPERLTGRGAGRIPCGVRDVGRPRTERSALAPSAAGRFRAAPAPVRGPPHGARQRWRESS
ncbi:hypothetical protein [Kineococcus arenarius]|uniref:hypothetical protein n=1 Tax=Kineococcus sp. SYSU DK019 TaxID=3383140 RepID=UPI003D7C9154